MINFSSGNNDRVFKNSTNFSDHYTDVGKGMFIVVHMEKIYNTRINSE